MTISKQLFELGFQMWLVKVDRMLLRHGNWHEDYPKTDWRAMYSNGYLATTAVYEATKK